MSRNSGKWYAEFTLTTFTIRSGSYPYIGVAQLRILQILGLVQVVLLIIQMVIFIEMVVN